MKNFCIIGSGRQGTAAAYDIVKHGDPNRLIIIDADKENLKHCAEKIKKLTGFEVETSNVDIHDRNLLIQSLSDIDIFLSSVPYPYNLYLTEVAIDSSTSMVDLGGHTQNVIKQLEFSNKAINAGITIVPDCGMGPGMNVSVALLSMDGFDQVEEVRVWDGGLPQKPELPWNYNLFFNIQGLTNEYDGSAYFIRNGKVVEVECFEDIENLNFEYNLGELEAAVTSGGLSTMPWTYEGKIKVLENKTLRYLGHWDTMIAFRQLGLFSEKEVDFKNMKISPREFYHHLLEPQLLKNEPRDVCIMRAESTGLINGETKKKRVECIENYNDETEFLAMEQWTGYHASMVMQHIVNGKVPLGAHPIEKALSGADFYDYAKSRGYKIKINYI